MSTVIRGNMRMALASIKRSRLRSGFTMFGVIIAVLPVLIILGVGEGATRQVERQVDALGASLITVRPGNIERADPLDKLNNLSGTNGQGGVFSTVDLAAIMTLESLGSVSPATLTSGRVEVNDESGAEVLIVGTNSSLPELINKEVQYGEFFSDAEQGRNFAVIGRGAAEAIFKEAAPLGRSFVWRGETFMVRGVLERFTVPPLAISVDYNEAIIVPFKTVETVTGSAPIYEILTKPAAEVTVEQARDDIEQALTVARGGSTDFSVLTQADSLRITNEVLLLLTGFVAAVSAIALFVAGIGIMNIMLVSVAERTQEIGIRKAIGATKHQIMDQFMAEAAVLTCIGSLIGVGLAFVAQYFIGLFSPIQPFITWQAVLIVLGVSLAVGLLFGTIPAFKAARKDPIAALRQQ